MPPDGWANTHLLPAKALADLALANRVVMIQGVLAAVTVQRQQAQQFNKERKSAAGGEGSSPTATTQQDTTHHEENFAGADDVQE